MTDLEHKKNRLKKLEEGNERSYLELRKEAPRFGMDTSDLRRELFIDNLVEWGVISEEQKLDFDIKFHQAVEDALNKAWAEFRSSQSPKLSIVKKPSQLLDSQGRPL